MTKNRFKQLKKYVVFMFEEKDQASNDPWYQIVGAVEAYNENRRNKVKSSLLKVLDESMSAFHLQTQKNGNVPHISSIQYLATRPA